MSISSVWSIYNKTSIFSYDIKSLENMPIYLNVYEYMNIFIKYTYKTHINIYIYTHTLNIHGKISGYIRTEWV